MKIYFTETAMAEFQEVISFLEKHWPKSVADDLLTAIDKEFVHLRSFPQSYPALRKDAFVRKCVVKKKTVLLYQVKETMIEIVGVYDHRQNYQDKEKWK